MGMRGNKKKRKGGGERKRKESGMRKMAGAPRERNPTQGTGNITVRKIY